MKIVRKIAEIVGAVIVMVVVYKLGLPVIESITGFLVTLRP